MHCRSTSLLLPSAAMLNFTIRDAIWCMVLAAMSMCWYADRTVSENSVRNLRVGLEAKEIEQRQAARNMADWQKPQR